MGWPQRGWTKFRSWPLWVQILIGFLALSVIVGPFIDEEEPDTETTGGTSVRTTEQTTTTQRETTTEAPTTSEASTTTTMKPTTTVAPPPSPTTTVPPPPPPPPPTTTLPPPPAPAPATSGCHPSYDPCVPLASDVDCIGGSGDGPEYVGTVTVSGSDPYGLDDDGDGVGCESAG